jgi:hypothetical protein
MNWLEKIIIEGIQACIVIRMRYAPELDAIEQVADVWLLVFKKQPILWDEEMDSWRVKEAFLLVMGSSKTFPTPKEVLESMPNRKAIEFRLPRPEGTPMPQNCKAELEKLLGFGVKR